MQKHIIEDKVIDDREKRKIENRLNRETSDWLKILRAGENVGQANRTKFNLVTKENPVPVLRGTAKDHKVAKNVISGHELRPIMAATVGPNTGISQIGCKILRAVSDKVKENKVVKSTEEMLRKFSDYNEKVRNRVSQDVPKSCTSYSHPSHGKSGKSELSSTLRPICIGAV